MSERPVTPLLDTIEIPSDLRRLKADQLRQVADELRAEMISAVSVTGGHLGAGLGVVELTVAVHYVFNTPEDVLVWDVGHQAYPHKILTGRRDRIRTLRQGGGLSGFTRRAESEYDPFGAAHSSTSISAALGFATANKLAGKPGKAIAIIGDGAMSAGMAYEAMNNAEVAGNRLVVILNDNDMSIAPPVGGLSAYLAWLVSSKPFLSIRDIARRVVRRLPRRLHDAARRTDEFARGMAMGGTLFEQLGFYYVGPVDGHNLDHLIPVLENVRDAGEGPILIHVVTNKGKGYAPAEASADKYHGVQKFDVVSGKQDKAPAGPPAYQNIFADQLVREAQADDQDAKHPDRTESEEMHPHVPYPRTLEQYRPHQRDKVRDWIDLRGPLCPHRHPPEGCEQSAHEEIDHQQREGDEHRLLLTLHNCGYPEPDSQCAHQIDRRREKDEHQAAPHRHVENKPRDNQPYCKIGHRKAPERYEFRRNERRSLDRCHIQLVQRACFLLAHDVHRRQQRANHRHQHHEDTGNHVLPVIELRVVPAASPYFQVRMSAQWRWLSAHARASGHGRADRCSKLNGVAHEDRVGV